jgi:DNA-binding protein YbaB
MNWHLIRESQEAKVLIQCFFYTSIHEKLKNIAAKEKVSMTTLIRSAINDAIEAYEKQVNAQVTQ